MHVPALTLFSKGFSQMGALFVCPTLTFQPFGVMFDSAQSQVVA